MKRRYCLVSVFIGLMFIAADRGFGQQERSGAKSETSHWKSFFPEKPEPGKELDGWTVTDFYGHGKVERDGDLIVLHIGKPLTGITYNGKKNFPTSNFEIELEARRTHGNDFLCGLTFPVGKGFCSFIAGGWGGGLVGLSSVNGSDASENSTSTFHDFKNDQWYRFRVAVDDEFIRCWIDDDQCVTQEREGHEFSTRIEVFASQPLGLCVFQSRVEVKNFRWRPLGHDEPAEKLEKSDEGKPSPVQSESPK